MKNVTNIDTAAGPDGMSRLKTAIGVAILAISCAGLMHSLIGAPWGLRQQVFYALVGGLACWGLNRPRRTVA